jgi:hypothetical protein
MPDASVSLTHRSASPHGRGMKGAQKARGAKRRVRVTPVYVVTGGDGERWVTTSVDEAVAAVAAFGGDDATVANFLADQETTEVNAPSWSKSPSGSSPAPTLPTISVIEEAIKDVVNKFTIRLYGSNTSRYTEGIVKETAEFLAVAKKEGFSPVEFRTIVDQAKLAKGKLTARETTGRAMEEPYPDGGETEASASIEDAAVEITEPEKPHWKDVQRPGEGLAAFIKREFEPELAAGTMARPMLNRYRGLYKAFDNQLRRHPADLPPELRDILKKPEANDRSVAEGKVAAHPAVPPPPRTDERRVYERDRKRITAAAQRRDHS